MVERESAAELRAELVDSIARWREDMPPDNPRPSTNGAGAAAAAIAVSERLLTLAVARLLPDAVIPNRATLGIYIDILKREGGKRRLQCVHPGRRMLTPSEKRILERFSSRRNEMAHPDVQAFVAAAYFGRIKPAELHDLFNLVEQLLAMPLIDELVCLELRDATEGGDIETPSVVDR